MRARVERLRKIAGEFHPSLDTSSPESQLTISESWAQLCGPKFGHRATGRVQSVSVAYAGADYHFHVDVLVEENVMSGAYHMERWFVHLLEVKP